MADVLVSPIASRKQFGRLLNERGLTGYAVEIGTHLGVFARMWLDSWPVGMLHCVDPWRPLASYDDAINTRDREADYQEAKKRLADQSHRVAFIRKTSLEAAAAFNDESLDCVYIDGNHWRPFVDHDIAAWWPKVRHGGILAGHDWSDFWSNQVQPAVHAFADANQLPIHVINEFEATWYVVKP